MQKLILFFVFASYEIAAAQSGPSPISKVCGAGCDYTADYVGLQAALNSAASYQDSTACVPYVIELSAQDVIDLRGAMLVLPPKRCAQYVRLRSSELSGLPVDGTRVNPATEGGRMARIQSTTPTPAGAMMGISPLSKTRYWAFEGIDFFANGGSVAGAYSYNALLFFGDTVGADYPVSADPRRWPDHLEIKHCWFHGVPGYRNVQHALHLTGANLLVRDSVIEDISADGYESHAILGSIVAYDLRVMNNTLDAASGDFFLGGVWLPAGVIPTFIEFAGNRVTKKSYYKYTSSPTDPAWPCRPGNVHKNTSTGHEWTCGSGDIWTDTGTFQHYGPTMVKNLWEIKAGRGVRVYGNDLSGIWWPSLQNGQAFVLSISSQWPSSVPSWIQPWNIAAQPWLTIEDVYIGANYVHDGFTFMDLGYPGSGPYGLAAPCGSPSADPVWCYWQAHNDIRVHNNIAYNMADERDYDRGAPVGGWFALWNTSDFNLDFNHNTYLLSNRTPASGAMSKLLALPDNSTITGTIHLTNNILPLGLYGIKSSPNGLCVFLAATDGHATYDWRGNVPTTDKLSWNGSSYPISPSPVPPSCPGYNKWPIGTPVLTAGTTGPSLVDGAYRVTVASGLRGTAADGRDPGADGDLLSWVAGTSVTGSFNPDLHFRIRSAMPTSSGSSRGVRIYFTAPSANSCTWQLSSDPNAYTAPIPVGYQTRNGQDGIATWTNLAPGTVYYALAKCDGHSLETGTAGRRFRFITAPW